MIIAMFHHIAVDIGAGDNVDELGNRIPSNDL
jgi:hypothetical protein